MKKLIVLFMLLMIGTANARIVEVEYKKTADNIFEVKSKWGHSILFTKGCDLDRSYLEQWVKGYVQEEQQGNVFYYQLSTKFMTCPVMDIQEIETYEVK